MSEYTKEMHLAANQVVCCMLIGLRDNMIKSNNTEEFIKYSQNEGALIKLQKLIEIKNKLVLRDYMEIFENTLASSYFNENKKFIIDTLNEKIKELSETE